ncbi:hypothetical protein GQ44DRAFT_774717 [Phaeosphaeriaceae sp. PMI808]|nr:hypothetical protein GQ44DRAFT_774717 [Phaeosphaeriaceae sp. PMI808]
MASTWSSWVVAFSVLQLLPLCLTSVLNDCEALSKSLPGKVFFGGNSQYDGSVSSYFYVQSRLSPACVVTPKSAEDVSSIVKRLSQTGSPFAVRGGGHASQPGAANSQGGVSIDMQSMATVGVTGDGSVAAVGAGATWDQVYSLLDQRNLAALGGRAAHVGVGGISFFSPERGFACDYVVNFQIVLPSGQITNANATFNKGLFIALKGGVNNFGIITRYDIKTFKQGTFWGGGITYPETAYDQLIAAFVKGKQPENYDPYTTMEPSFVYAGALKFFLGATSLYYTKPIVNATSLADFTSIQPQMSNTMRISNTTDFANEVLSLSTPNQSSIWATTTFAISPSIISRILPIWKSSALAMNLVANVTSSMTLQSIPPPAPQNSPNSLGFSSSSKPQENLVLLLLSIFFEDANAYSKLNTLSKDFFAAVDKVADEEYVNEDYTYLNYAAAWQDPLKDYGPASYAHLVKTANAIDPKGMFQKQTGGYKLFRRGVKS